MNIFTETVKAREARRIIAPEIATFAPGIESAFPQTFPEQDCIVESTGEPVPDFIKGTYYLNGPARFGFGDLSYKHWLDGDGMLASLQFRKDEMRFRSRYIRSRKRVDEEAAGVPLFRTFGTSFSGSRLNSAGNGLESPVNVSAYSFDNKLLAFGEQGLPWELDPETLETRRQFTFNGRLNDASPFSAHPKFDGDSGEMYNFGVFFSPKSPRLCFYCFDSEGLRYRKSVPLEFPCSVHDFALSRNYAAFYLSPYLLNAGGLLDGRTVMELLSWEPEKGSRIVILSRSTGELVASIPAGNRYCLHLINAFEEEGCLILDILEFDEPLYGQYQPVADLFQTVSHGGPVRFILDLKSREIKEKLTLNYCKAPDFPAIDPRLFMHRYDDFWVLGISHTGKDGRKFFDQLVHANWTQNSVYDIYQSLPYRYLGGEPVFLAEPGSRNGMVMCQEFDARSGKCQFLLFEAGRVAKGPVTRIPLEGQLYLGFHAAFSPDSHVF